MCVNIHTHTLNYTNYIRSLAESRWGTFRQSPKAIVIRVHLEDVPEFFFTYFNVVQRLTVYTKYFIYELLVLFRPRRYRNSEYFAAVSRDIHSALMSFSEPL